MSENSMFENIISIIIVFEKTIFEIIIFKIIVFVIKAFEISIVLNLKHVMFNDTIINFDNNYANFFVFDEFLKFKKIKMLSWIFSKKNECLYLLN